VVTHHKIIAKDRQLETQRISFLDIVQTLAAYVAIPVALLYPVGVFALFAPVHELLLLGFLHGVVRGVLGQ
jgi:hypothetical protein